MTRQTRQTGRARQTGESTQAASQAASQAAPASEVGPGRARQAQIYRAGALGQRPRVPADAEELERRARRTMSRRAWAYVAGGAGSGRTVRANREAFQRRSILPRMLAGAATRDLGTTLLGRRLPAPLLLAPIGAADLVRRGADLLSAAAAAELAVPYVISSQGCSPMEEVAAAMGTGPRWFQLYWSTDEALVDSLLHRAEAVGAEAVVVVTLDTTMLGWRPQDLDLGSLPFAQGIGIAQYTSDPRFREVVAERLASRRAAGAPDQGHAGRGQDPGVDQPPAPRHPPAQPALPRAPGRRRGLPRHLLQPRAQLGRTSPRCGSGPEPAHRAQGNPAPRRRAPGPRPRGQRHRRLQPRRPAGRRGDRVTRRAARDPRGRGRGPGA